MRKLVKKLGLGVMALGIILLIVHIYPPTPLAEINPKSEIKHGSANKKSMPMPDSLRQAVFSRLQVIEADPDNQQAYRTQNPEQALSIRFNSRGVAVSSQSAQDTWTWGMELKSYGYGKDLQPVEHAKLKTEGNRITYDRGNLKEWYVNDSPGLEQGFVLTAPPTGGPQDGGADKLVLSLALSGDLEPTWIKKG